MEKLRLDKNTLKKFGITMGSAFLIITLFLMIRHRHNLLPTISISVLFFMFALLLPALLKPVYIFWMRLAFVLSWVNTRLLLLIIFYLIFTPFGLVMRLLSIDLLQRKIDKNNKSYWQEKEKKEFNILNYERQF